ncbi:MAG: ATP-binding protein, partial [Bacteroidia bacterium]
MKNIFLVLIIALITNTTYGQQNHAGNNSLSVYVDSAIFYFNKSKTADDGIDSLVFEQGLRMMDSIPVDDNSVKRIEKAAENFKGVKKSSFYNKIKWKMFLALEYNREYYREIDYGKAIINRYDGAPNPDDKNLFILVLSNLRIPFRVTDRLDDGFDFYTSKLKLYIQRNDSAAISTCYFVHGGFYFTRGLNDLSIYYYKKSIPYLNVNDTIDGGVSSGRFKWRNNTSVVGDVSNTIGDYKNAIFYSRAALDVGMNNQNDSSALTYIYKNIAYAKIMLNEPDSVMGLLNKGIENTIGDFDSTYVASCYLVKGIYYLKMTRLDSSEFYLQECNRLMDKYGINANSPAGNINPGYYLALVRIKQNRFKDAGELLKAEIPRLVNLRAELISEYKLLVEVYLNSGDVKNANETFIQYNILQEQLKEDERSNRKMSFETEQKITDAESTITNLTAEKKLAALSRNYLVGIAALLLIIALVIYNRFRIIRSQKVIIEKEKHRAEQSEKFKQQFLANMSHEIRTPMNAVMGMTNLLIDKNKNTENFKYLDGIQKSSDTLLHIINDILDFSKIEAGKIELEQIDFSIRDVVDQVKLTLHHKAEEKGLHLITKIENNVPDILIGDPVRLNQVLMNLAGNAIKFTEKGSVCITVSPIPSFPGGERVASAQETPPLRGGRVGLLFSITDTGIGIPKDKLQSVFESFSQAHASDARKFGGTGLGLTISKQLVELMDGKISIESEEGSGTTFSFEIDFAMGSKERLQEQKTAEDIDGSILNGLRILVVDDNEFNRIVAIDTLLSKAAVEIVEAHNGMEAVEWLSKKDFDVVLMDVQMPVMDGYEATRQIRNPQSAIRNHKIPVIALTASVVRSDLDKCRAAGMNDYVPKPFKTF